MRTVIKKVPLPLGGVMLGTASLGNLLQSYSETFRSICGIAAGVFLVLLLLKAVCYPTLIREDLNNPVMASIAGTVPMSLMLLSTYIKPFAGRAALGLWGFAVLLHLGLIVYFTIKFIVRLQLKQVFASYYIVYVGIVVAALTAPAYGMPGIGAAAFWFGFPALLVLLILTTVRYVKHQEIQEPARPLLCICAAPASLCTAGYIQSVGVQSIGFLTVLYITAVCLYLFALVKALGYLRLPFYPSYASFTFPFVISAIASKQVMAYAANSGSPIPALRYMVLVQTAVAVVFVGYTIIRYTEFFIRPAR